MMLSSPPLTLPSSYPFHFLPSSSDPPYDLLRTHPSLSLLHNCNTLKSLRQIHSQMIKTGLHNTNYALSKLLEFCVLSPHFDGFPYAVSVFETIHEPNLLIWNTMFRGYASSSDSVSALRLYVVMISLGLLPNAYTFPFLLKICGKLKAFRVGEQLHGHVSKLGFGVDLYVHTSLISMYVQNGRLEGARQMFDKSSHRDAVSYTALITGYVSRGDIGSARKMFDEIPVRDVVSWNAMISGYAGTGKYDEALELFNEMMKMKVRPDESTMVTVVSGCAQSGSIELGRQVHSWIDGHGFGSNLKIVNALIGLYSKCGEMETACCLFEGLLYKDVISWNTLIGGYTHMNLYKEALLLFQEMLRSGESPNDVTMLSVLPACSHLGAIDIGRWIHVYIDKKLKGLVTNGSSLRTSLIDMYAKCGDIEAAQQVFNSMLQRGLSSWNAMVFGFAMHGKANAAFDLFSRMRRKGLNQTISRLLVCCLLVAIQVC